MSDFEMMEAREREIESLHDGLIKLCIWIVLVLVLSTAAIL